MGLFTALVFSAAFKVKVCIVLAGHVLEDLLLQFAPRLCDGLGGYVERSEVILAPCIQSGNLVRMPTREADLLLCNHYTPLFRNPTGRAVIGDHKWCAGRLCGGPGYPCIAPLAQAVAKMEFAPWPVPGDGDCAVHGILFCTGQTHLGPSGALARERLRGRLRRYLLDHLDDEELQSACVRLGEKGLAYETVHGAPHSDAPSKEVIPPVDDAMGVQGGALVDPVDGAQARPASVGSMAAGSVSKLQTASVLPGEHGLARETHQGAPHCDVASQDFIPLVDQAVQVQGGARVDPVDGAQARPASVGSMAAESVSKQSAGSADISAPLPPPLGISVGVGAPSQPGGVQPNSVVVGKESEAHISSEQEDDITLGPASQEVIAALASLSGKRCDAPAHAFLLHGAASRLSPEEQSALILKTKAGGACKRSRSEPHSDERTPSPKKRSGGELPSAEKNKKTSRRRATKNKNKKKQRQSRRRAEGTLAQRVAVGEEFMEWKNTHCRERGYRKRDSGCAKYCRYRFNKYCGRPNRDYIARCVALAKLKAKGQLHEAMTSKRAHGGGAQAGRAHKCPEIRESLFRWFVDIRKVCKGRFPPHLLKQQAEYLRREALIEAARHQVPVDIPEIDSGWLRRWRKDFRVSMRQPTLCWKVPRRVFLERCRICWSNVYRARLFIQHLCGYDPVVEGFDQKPFHFCESGSKSRKTLDFTGKRTITLRECHAATRERWTANTWTSSDRCGARAGTPLEVMFKGGSGVLQTALEALEAVRASGRHGPLRNVSVNTSASGSYGKVEVLEFLRRHLLPWSEGRRWRILLADAFKPHLCEEVRRLCWNRGYLLVYIGGGCTPALQVNDTHLHGPLSFDYQQREMALLAAHMEINPKGLKVMSREDCLRTLVEAYERDGLHAQVAEGYNKNLFTVALDGSEDETLGTEQAKEVFAACHMVEERAIIVADMKDEHEADRLELTYECFTRHMANMPSRGHLDHVEDGMDDEIEAFWEGDPWDDAAGAVSDGGEENDAADLQILPVGGGAQADPNGHAEDLSESQADEVARQAEQLRLCEAIIENVKRMGDQGMLASAMKAKRRLQQQASGNKQQDAAVAQAVRRAVANMETERRRRQEQHAETMRQASAPKDAKTRLMAEQEEVKRNEGALRERLREERRSADIRNAAVAFEARDFLGADVGAVVAQKNRLNAFRRVMGFVSCLPPGLARQLATDFAVWDRGQQTKCIQWHLRFVNIVADILSKVEAGREVAVATWWEQQVAGMAPARLVLPALPAPAGK